ncbi:MAG: PHP domain-containing protein [Erysipelotrichaceae bacterium]|jgi:predicted metal-dependent phosphoesterase TrpH|nr:PHP domain-containing protein [Erysipelotrichaceae bacterium]
MEPVTSIIDLHTHSSYSTDGSYTPAELIALCEKANVKIVSLTDHNCVRGVKEMMEAGASKGITVIPGIEIDCVYKGTGLHITGYNIDMSDPRFYQLEETLNDQERAASEERVQLIEKLGIYVNHDKLDKLKSDGIVFGEMIAEACLYEDENQNHPLLAPFKPGGALEINPLVNFYWEFCAQGKPAYIPIDLPDLCEIIDLIHDNNGLAVFAHPGNNIHEDMQLLQEIMACGLEGIEAYSSYHNFDQVKFFRDYADKTNKLVTCGSDFHGRIKPSIKLGKIAYPEVYLQQIKTALGI